jgi:four helix bundle protein
VVVGRSVRVCALKTYLNKRRFLFFRNLLLLKNMARVEHLIIFQKTYNFLKEVYTDCNNFPKSQKFVLAQRIEGMATDTLKKIVIANQLKNKKTILKEINVEIEVLRIYIRLAKDLRFLSGKRYILLSEYLDEIAKMLFSWINKSV